MVLEEANLRTSHLWAGVGAIQQGIPFPSLKQTWSVLLTHYCSHTLYGKSRLNPLTIEEFAIAKKLMKKLTVPSANKSITRCHEKRKRESSAREERRAEDVAATPPSLQPAAEAESSKTVVLDEETEMITFSIMASTSTYSDTASISQLTNSFLFPADETRLNQMGVVTAVDWGVSRAFQV